MGGDTADPVCANWFFTLPVVRTRYRKLMTLQIGELTRTYPLAVVARCLVQIDFFVVTGTRLRSRLAGAVKTCPAHTESGHYYYY